MTGFRIKKILIFLSVLSLIATNSVLAKEKKTLKDLFKKNLKMKFLDLLQKKAIPVQSH